MSSTQASPLYHLRALSTSALFDLMALDPAKHAETIGELLKERGLPDDRIEQEIARRSSHKSPRCCTHTNLFRVVFLLLSLGILWFNARGAVLLYQATSSYKTFLIIFILMTIAFGFYLGLKFNMFLYLGNAQRVFCGFPIPVGFVDTCTAEEILPAKPRFFLSLLINGLISVNFSMLVPMLAVSLLN